MHTISNTRLHITNKRGLRAMSFSKTLQLNFLIFTLELF